MARADREASVDAHDDRHDACDQCSGSGHRCDRGAHIGGDGMHLICGQGGIPVRILGLPGDQIAIDIVGGANDQWVKHDDVSHREEGDEPAPDFASESGATFGELEPGIQSFVCGRGRISRRGVSASHAQNARTNRHQLR